MLIEDKDKKFLEVLDQRFEHNIHIWGHEKHRYFQRLQRNALLFTSFIGSFA